MSSLISGMVQEEGSLNLVIGGSRFSLKTWATMSTCGFEVQMRTFVTQIRAPGATGYQGTPLRSSPRRPKRSRTPPARRPRPRRAISERNSKIPVV